MTILLEAFLGRLLGHGPSGPFFFFLKAWKCLDRLQTAKQVQGAELGSQHHRAVILDLPGELLAWFDFEGLSHFRRHRRLAFICQGRLWHGLTLPRIYAIEYDARFGASGGTSL